MIVSLISGGCGYLDGARALAASLREYEPNIQRILLVERFAYSEEKIRLAENAGWEIRIVDPVRPKAKVRYKARRWPNTLSKLHIWGVESQVAVYIDADCIVLKPFWNDLVCRDFERLAACWVVRGSTRFNSGVMAIKPSKELHSAFIDEVTNGNPAVTHVAGSDQSYLNVKFPVWTQVPDRFNFRNWSVRPGNLTIAHIRPHPWSEKEVPSKHYRDIVAVWRSFLSRSC